MVDYDAAVAAVQDPDADPVFLARIAYENPEFGANVAVNPRAYPGLIRWLAAFGDERARRTVAQLGYPVPDSPVVAPADEAPAASATEGPDAAYSAIGGPATPQGSPQPAADPASAAAFEARPAASYGESASVQPARNPYGFTAEQAATTTDQMLMARIARDAPELHADLARNPHLYPALVDWLAQLRDPAVDATLAARSRRF